MNGWKVTAIGVSATALVTGLVVVGSIGGHRSAREQNSARPVPARVASNLAIPGRSDVNACNKYAASEVTSVEAGASRAVVGAADGGSVYGLDESKKQDERYRVAYASCMRARGFAS
jgi:hypothetical protein